VSAQGHAGRDVSGRARAAGRFSVGRPGKFNVSIVNAHLARRQAAPRQPRRRPQLTQHMSQTHTGYGTAPTSPLSSRLPSSARGPRLDLPSTPTSDESSGSFPWVATGESGAWAPPGLMGARFTCQNGSDRQLFEEDPPGPGRITASQASR